MLGTDHGAVRRLWHILIHSFVAIIIACGALLTTMKKFNIGVHSDVYEAITIKPSVKIVTIELCASVQVWMTLTFIQGHSSMRIASLPLYLSVFSVSLGGIWYAVETFWCDEPCVHVILGDWF